MEQKQKVEEAVIYTEGVLAHGAAILKNGVRMSIKEVLEELNSRYQSLPTNSMQVDNDFINRILKIAYKAVPKKCVIDGNKLIEVHNELGDVLKSEFQKQLPSAPTEPNIVTANAAPPHSA